MQAAADHYLDLRLLTSLGILFFKKG